MEVVIITGASRGIGDALAHALLSAQRQVICIARTPNPALAEAARQKNAWLEYYLQDLSDVMGTQTLARSICEALPADATRAILFNNAAMLETVDQAEQHDAAMVADVLHVNVNAAITFTSAFIKGTSRLAGPRQIVNISSGAGRTPIDGWSIYCTSKAALDMYSRCVSLEQKKHANGVRVASLGPGVIDTAMQTMIRAVDVSRFPDVARFQAMKDNGQLAAAADVAKRIIAFLDHPEFGVREVDDLRNYSS